MCVTAGASGFLLTLFFYIVSLIFMYYCPNEVLKSRLSIIGLLFLSLYLTFLYQMNYVYFDLVSVKFYILVDATFTN